VYFLQTLRMSRLPPKARLNNPIRKLREVLARPGNKSLSQTELAPLIDVPLDLLKRVEAARAKFNRQIQNRILLQTGAAWNENDKCWRFWEETGPKFTREHYEKYRELTAEHVEGTMLQLDTFFAAARIKLLMEALPPTKRSKFLFRLNTFLTESQEELCPNDFVEFFYDACGRVTASPERDRDHPMRVSRFYFPRIMRCLPDLKKLEEWAKIQFDLAGYEKMIKQERARDVTGVLPRAKKRRVS
jgi:hypothetical protein